MWKPLVILLVIWAHLVSARGSCPPSLTVSLTKTITKTPAAVTKSTRTTITYFTKVTKYRARHVVTHSVDGIKTSSVTCQPQNSTLTIRKRDLGLTQDHKRQQLSENEDLSGVVSTTMSITSVERETPSITSVGPATSATDSASSELTGDSRSTSVSYETSSTYTQSQTRPTTEPRSSFVTDTAAPGTALGKGSSILQVYQESSRSNNITVTKAVVNMTMRLASGGSQPVASSFLNKASRDESSVTVTESRPSRSIKQKSSSPSPMPAAPSPSSQASSTSKGAVDDGSNVSRRPGEHGAKFLSTSRRSHEDTVTEIIKEPCTSSKSEFTGTTIQPRKGGHKAPAKLSTPYKAVSASNKNRKIKSETQQMTPSGHASCRPTTTYINSTTLTAPVPTVMKTISHTKIVTSKITRRNASSTATTTKTRFISTSTTTLVGRRSGTFTDTPHGKAVFNLHKGIDFPQGNLAKCECRGNTTCSVNGQSRSCTSFQDCMTLCAAYNLAPDGPTCMGVTYAYAGRGMGGVEATSSCLLKWIVPPNKILSNESRCGVVSALVDSAILYRQTF